MFGDNNDNANNQQPAGDSTPPPLLDTPISNDPSADSAATDPANTSSTEPEQSMPAPQPDWLASPSEPSSALANEDAKDADKTDGPATTASSKSDDFMNDTTPAASDDKAAPNSNDLLDIKQQALQQLTPLVDHLDQSPKEEFRTTMMMIQATDNSELIQKAFAAAQKIEDDKERAQAFLDLINEINYFTQQHEQ